MKLLNTNDEQIKNSIQTCLLNTFREKVTYFLIMTICSLNSRVCTWWKI